MVDWHYIIPPKEKVTKHYGPGSHVSGSPQSAHSGGKGKKKTLENVAVGDVIKLTRHGTKWTVEGKREPQRPFGGYIALRSTKGTRKVIGHRDWDIPIHSVEAEGGRKGKGSQ